MERCTLMRCGGGLVGRGAREPPPQDLHCGDGCGWRDSFFGGGCDLGCLFLLPKGCASLGGGELQKTQPALQVLTNGL